jgi:hypothetical protein
MQAGMARSRWFTVLSLVLGVGAGLAGAGCKDEKPDGSTVRLQQEYRDQEKKKTEDAAREKAKKELDELIPRLMEKRKPLDAAFQGMWQSLPDVKGMKRKECPDKQILADTPDPEKRKVLVFNKESLYLLTGQADGRPDAGAEAIHTVAAYHAFGLRRPEGKETPLLDRSVPAARRRRLRRRPPLHRDRPLHRLLRARRHRRQTEADARRGLDRRLRSADQKTPLPGRGRGRGPRHRRRRDDRTGRRRGGLGHVHPALRQEHGRHQQGPHRRGRADHARLHEAEKMKGWPRPALALCLAVASCAALAPRPEHPAASGPAASGQEASGPAGQRAAGQRAASRREARRERATGVAVQRPTSAPRAQRPASAGSPRCPQNLVILYGFTRVTPDDYDFPLTRQALKGHTELSPVRFVVTRDLGKKYLAAIPPSFPMGQKLVNLIEKEVKGSKPQIVCAVPEIVRELKVDLKTGAIARP